MSTTAELELELKHFIIETLNLEDISVEDIGSEDILFGEGLGLDSVDALELAVAIQKKYDIEIDPKDEATTHHFTSIRNLATFIAETRPAAEPRRQSG